MYYSPNTRSSINTLKVTGEGLTQTTPTHVSIIMGVFTESSNLQTAQNENAVIMTRVNEALLQQTIPKENIKTIEYRIHPQYHFIEGEQVFRGYRVTNMFEVTVEPIEKTGQIVDLAVTEGVNEVRNINFTSSNEQYQYLDALSKAMVNAKQKAVTLADEMNVNLSSSPIKVKEVIQQQNNHQTPFVLAATSEDTSTPIEPGQLELRATVHVTYSYY